MKDSDGRTLREVRTAAGFHGSLESVRLPAGYYDAFVELHIEQGPLLERRGVPIGAVKVNRRARQCAVDIPGFGRTCGRGSDARPARCLSCRG